MIAHHIYESVQTTLFSTCKTVKGPADEGRVSWKPVVEILGNTSCNSVLTFKRFTVMMNNYKSENFVQAQK